MLYCWNDSWGYGKELADAFAANGGQSMMIAVAAQVPNEFESIAFVNYIDSRTAQNIYQDILELEMVRTIPYNKIVNMVSNPLEQHNQLDRYMPTVWHLKTLRDAMGVISKIHYPVTSVRKDESIVLNSSDDAYKECIYAFDKKQQGYLFLRTEISIEREWFVCMLGKRYAFIVERAGDGLDMVNVLNERHIELLKYIYAVVQTENIDWVVLRVVTGLDKERDIRSPFIVDMHVTWPPEWLNMGGMVFGSTDGENWTSTGKPAKMIFDFAAKLIIEDVF
jgi:hypothetical protein